MGSGISSLEAEVLPAKLYEMALLFPDFFPLPDVGVDESLLKYSGLDSNSVLQTYSNDLVNTVPAYIERLGSSVGSITSVPNAVGLGALVLAMVMEICIKSTSQTNDNSYSMFQRVFGEEKASTVRDTVQEYVKRHRMFMNNEQRLREELKRLEQQLSGHLTSLKNSLLQDGQMSTRGFKIWVNGAYFHVQMMIHEARLNDQIGQRSSEHLVSTSAAIDQYLQDLKMLLPKYKTFRADKTTVYCVSWNFEPQCCFNDNESGWSFNHCSLRGVDISKAFVNEVFSKHEPITGLTSHFSKLKRNLNSLIKQHSAFTVPRP